MFLNKFAPYKFAKPQQMQTRDGVAWSAVLMLGKTKVLHVEDGGYGGALDITPIDREAHRAFEAHVAALPPAFFDDPVLPSLDGEPAPTPGSLSDRVEAFLTLLGDATETDKRMRRTCRAKTVARWKTDPPGEFRIYKVRFSPAVAQAIRERDGDVIDFFLNERLG